jgi:predicted kinase
MLIAFGGLPGTGKTTLAKALVAQCAAVYLRIDTIEQAIRDSDVLRNEIGPAGYVTAYRLAEENLRLGQSVVADSVNSLLITRDSWAQVARSADVTLVNVEVICSDLVEHRRRIEGRDAALGGSPPLTGLTSLKDDTRHGQHLTLWWIPLENQFVTPKQSYSNISHPSVS